MADTVSVTQADDIRRNIIRQLGDDPHAYRVILPDTDWDVVLQALRLASTQPAPLPGEFGSPPQTAPAWAAPAFPREEVERLLAALERCAEIVERNLYRQHEKIEDVPKIARAAVSRAALLQGKQP